MVLPLPYTPSFPQLLNSLNQKSEQELRAALGQPFLAAVTSVTAPKDSMYIYHFGGGRTVKITHPYMGLTAWHRVGPEPGMSLIMQTRLDSQEAEGFLYYVQRPKQGDQNERVTAFEEGKGAYRPIDSGEQELNSKGFAQIFLSRRAILDIRGGYVRGWYDQDRVEAGAKAATHHLVLHKNVPNRIGDELRLGVVYRPGTKASSSVGVPTNSATTSSAPSSSTINSTTSTPATSSTTTTREPLATFDPRHKLSGVHPEAVKRVKAMAIALEDLGIKITVQSGVRTVERQNELYAEGRDSSGNVVDKNKVITNARGGWSFHNYGTAVDILPLGPNNKSNKDLNNPQWGIIASEAEKAKLTWGGNFPNLYDPVHVELPMGSVKAKDFYQTYQTGGLSAVWALVAKQLGLQTSPIPSTDPSTGQQTPQNAQTSGPQAQTSSTTSPNNSSAQERSSVNVDYIKSGTGYAREFMYVLNSGNTTPPVLVDHREGNVIDDTGKALSGKFGNDLRMRKLYYTTGNKTVESQVDEQGNIYVSIPDEALKGISLDVAKGDIKVAVNGDISVVTWDCKNTYTVTAQNDLKVESVRGISKFLGTKVKLGTNSASEPLILGNTYKDGEQQLFNQIMGLERSSGSAFASAGSAAQGISTGVDAILPLPFVPGAVLAPILTGVLSLINTLSQTQQQLSQQKASAYSTFNGNYDSFLSTVVKTA